MTADHGISHNWLKGVRASISSAMYNNGLWDDRSQSFITRERLRGVWLERRDGSCPLDELQSYLPTFSHDRIFNQLLSIISILIWIHWDDWGSLADRLNYEPGKLMDQNLPLSPEQCEEVFRTSPNYGADFHQFQYAFVPVQIEQNDTRTFLESKWRLPLAFEGPKNNTGSYGTVTKVGIAKGYFRTKDGTKSDRELIAARKLFDVQPSYEKEVHNLRILRSSALTHDRIMEHLGSIIIGGKFSIFFQWADLNLEQFLKDSERPATIRDEMITPRSLLKECFWLAHALQFLHTHLSDADGKPVRCCHRDLKPDNILVMIGDPAYPLGKWKITDFGISNIEPRSMSVSIRDFYDRTTTTRPATRPAGVRARRYPGNFQPPEAEPSEKAGYLTNGDLSDLEGDIWSFGCILLVILVFATGGNAYVDELEDRRQVQGVDYDDVSRLGRFYRKVFGGGTQIAPSIAMWIHPLAKTRAVWFQEAWSFVLNHMLVADPRRRVDAEVVCHNLHRLIDKAESSNTWKEAPDPQSFTSPSLSPVADSRQTATQNYSYRGDMMATTAQTSNLGYSPSSETRSQRSSTSNGSGSPGLFGNLSQDPDKDKNVVLSSDGQRIAFSNQYRAKVISKTQDDAATLLTEIIQNTEFGNDTVWEQIQLAGPIFVLRDEETLNIYSRNLLTEHEVQSWDKKVRTQHVVGFDISSRGAIAFRFPHAIKAFVSLESPEPSVEWGTPNEHVKAVAFSRSGDRLIAVCDMTWSLWELRESSGLSSGFHLVSEGKHQFSRREYGTSKPYIVLFNTTSNFLLWDEASRDRISMNTQDSKTVLTVSADTRAVAITHDDQKLVLLIVKAPLIMFGKYKYTLQWNAIILDPEGHLTIGREYQKHNLSFKSSAELSLSMVTLREHDMDIALIAFSDGHIERVQLV